MTKKKDEKVIDAIQQAHEISTQDRIKELEAKIREGEEAAFDRVCKAIGIESSEVKAKEASKKNDDRQVRLWVSYPINVNGRIYQGDVTVPYETSRVISQALGDRKNRLLRELTGNNYILKEMQGGGFAPHLLETVDASGERIA